MDRITWKAWMALHQGKYMEDSCQQTRLESGQDPDEYTIYNVLCPQIREKWSADQENSRRVFGKRTSVEVQGIPCPVGVKKLMGLL